MCRTLIFRTNLVIFRTNTVIFGTMTFTSRTNIVQFWTIYDHFFYVCFLITVMVWYKADIWYFVSLPWPSSPSPSTCVRAGARPVASSAPMALYSTSSTSSVTGEALYHVLHDVHCTNNLLGCAVLCLYVLRLENTKIPAWARGKYWGQSQNKLLKGIISFLTIIMRLEEPMSCTRTHVLAPTWSHLTAAVQSSGWSLTNTFYLPRAALEG